MSLKVWIKRKGVTQGHFPSYLNSTTWKNHLNNFTVFIDVYL